MESVSIDGMMTRTDWQAHQDMCSIITNHKPCPVEFVDKIPPCYPYGTLYLAPTMDDKIVVAFGDLRILTSPRKALELTALADSPQACFALSAFLLAA